MTAMNERLRNYRLLLRYLPLLLVNRQMWHTLRDMMAFVRRLPTLLQQPLPDAMRHLSAHPPLVELPEAQLRDLADLAAALERRSVPGICLKRSLTRYRYLTAIDVQLEIVFGVRFTEATQRKVAGHAWLEQNGVVYFESAENVTPFRPIFRWPPI